MGYPNKHRHLISHWVLAHGHPAVYSSSQHTEPPAAVSCVSQCRRRSSQVRAGALQPLAAQENVVEQGPAPSHSFPAFLPLQSVHLRWVPRHTIHKIELSFESQIPLSLLLLNGPLGNRFHEQHLTIHFWSLWVPRKPASSIHASLNPSLTFVPYKPNHIP